MPDNVTNATADVTNASDEDVHLDRLLHDWAEQTTDTGRLGDLRDRIIFSLTATDVETAFGVARQVRQESEPQQRRSSLRSGMVVASAAVLLVSMTVFLRRSSDLSVSNPQPPPDHAWLRDDQLQNQAVLFAAMEETFDGQLNWLVETNDHVRLGLAASTSSGHIPTDDKLRMAVRIVVERRSPRTNTWQVAWAVDVLAREEEVVDTHDNDGELKLWTFQLPDGAIAIDSEIRLTDTGTLHADSFGVQDDRQPIRIFDEQTIDGKGRHVEYRVFQTVAILDREVM